MHPKPLPTHPAERPQIHANGNIPLPPAVLRIGDAPHDWLFPQVAAKFLAVRDAEKTPEAPQQADPNAVRELYVEFNG